MSYLNNYNNLKYNEKKILKHMLFYKPEKIDKEISVDIINVLLYTNVWLIQCNNLLNQIILYNHIIIIIY